MMHFLRPTTPPPAATSRGARKTLRPSAAKFIVALSGPVALSLLLEVALRFNHSHCAAHPRAGWDRSPVFYEFKQAGYSLTGASDGCANVAVVGDSFAQGAGVQEDDRYAARLERALNTHPELPCIRVNCFAMAGTSTYQQLPLLRQALQGHPAVVILGICLNDTEDWTQPGELTDWREAWLPGKPTATGAWLARHSALCAMVQEKTDAVRMQKGRKAYFEHLYRADYSGWMRFAASIPLFKEECDMAHSRLATVIFPLLSDSFDPGAYPFEEQHKTIRRVMAASGVPCLDLLEAFRGKDPARMTAIPGIDPHPSEIAHRIATDQLVPFLIQDLAVVPEPYMPTESKQSRKWRALWERTNSRIHPGAIRPEIP